MIRNWHQFESIRNSDTPLLQELPNICKPILVAGCQRSGTTAITRVLRSCGDFGELHTTSDDELDAALILSGELPVPKGERLVLQTTYLNNHYKEYFEHTNFHLVWIVRNPSEVINSMLHNWSRGSLRRLFHACGSKQLDEQQSARYARFGHWAFSRLDMACYSYLEKSRQAQEISDSLSAEQVTFLDYEYFVAQPELSVQSLCRFFDIDYSDNVVSSLTSGRRRRAKSRLSDQAKGHISKMCNHAWRQNLKLVPAPEFGEITCNG